MRFVSIVGDSISTFTGYNPPGYHVFYEGESLIKNDISSVYDTWWAKVNQFLHAYICVNNSFSGSRVSGKKFPSANSDQRTSNLHTPEYMPNLILIYIGFNDFGRGIKIVADQPEDDSFFESYFQILQKIQKNYPNSRIICGTIMKSFLKDNIQWCFPQKWAGISIDEYNSAIKIAARLSGVEIADLASLEMRYETLDGTHPTANGHKTIANAWVSCLKKIPGL